MTNTINILGNEVSIKEYDGQRVVTFKDIDLVHQRPSGTAHRNFKANRNRFIEGIDFFRRNSSEAKSEFGVTAPNGLILITESGYLMLVKSFDDDIAWEVQRCLVNTYFKAKELVKGTSQNPCAYAQAKDRIALWKRNVSNPLIERLIVLTGMDDFVSAYACAYSMMKKAYGFDMNKAKFDYCQKYNVAYENCSVIDCVGDNAELRSAFEQCVSRKIRELSEDRVARAEEFAAYSDEIIRKAMQASQKLNAQITTTDSECNCLE